MTYPKRLIEVDLPIKEISAHARREKSIRHGHISTLHIWWARRPLAACRAVLCAALWPDPADALCPPAFREQAAAIITNFARKLFVDKTTSKQDFAKLCNTGSFGKYQALAKGVTRLDDLAQENQGNVLRNLLLDFIADFANWDASTVPEFLETARALTQAAHEALGGLPGTRPLVVDPFAGGGSIPLEALRVGADAFASDLNPVAVLLNKVVLEYIPKYGHYEFTMPDAQGKEITFHGLAEAVRYWGNWIKEQAERELAEFYPKDDDGATPIAYLWARTITCEGPGCGAEVPLMRSLWLAKKAKNSVALRMMPKVPGTSEVPGTSTPRIAFEIFHPASAKEVGEGTVKRGAATCPCCGYTTPVTSVRKQLKARRGGAHDARLFAVVTTKPGQQGRFYRLPTERDLAAVRKAAAELERRKAEHTGELSLVPDERSDEYHMFNNSTVIYGMETWELLFTPRQLLALATLLKFVQEIGNILSTVNDNEFGIAVQTALALAVSRQTDYTSSLCTWHLTRETLGHTFTKQALPMIWDFAEVFPLSESTGGFNGAIEWVFRVCEKNSFMSYPGQIINVSATKHPLPNDSVQSFITDPPYYFSVQYAGLSDFFYVWLKRGLQQRYSELFKTKLVPKKEEIVVSSPTQANASTGKNTAFFENQMGLALKEGRRIIRPDGCAVIVFAHLQTSAWEVFLHSLIEAGWVITGSWPIDTEMATRMIAARQSVLASSIHLVCRPRGNEEIGDWREVLSALPQRIHAWMPRLAQEGIVGADAIFACIGPALEIFSRYARVEKASGEAVTLGEYLEQVWAAVSKEALELVFQGADTSDFEPDARLTAIWLWTLNKNEEIRKNEEKHEELEEDEGEEEEDSRKPVSKSAGFGLEYDTARKIAQGLGANLEQLRSTVELKGGKARLLPVAERRKFLFGQEAGRKVPGTSARAGHFAAQQTLFASAAAPDMPDEGIAAIGQTVLDQVHQSMLLFADGRGDALRRLLVEDGVGKHPRFWKLADCLSKLYPSQTDEKRWVDGVLARKKGLGL